MCPDPHYTKVDMKTPGLIDSHLHLTDYEPGTDIAAMLEHASGAGVSHVVCNGTWPGDWPKVLDLASAYPQVIPCFGVHPWFVGRCPSDWLAVLEDFVRHVPCGIGEIGLDRYREPYDASVQEAFFRAQLGIARKYNRPAMIHCVKAWGWLVDILRSEPALPCGMLIHSYGGSADTARILAGMGAYFSFGGKVLEPNYARARESLRAIPLDRLLVETDAPCMLPPEAFRIQAIPSLDGTELFNHPANLPHILRGIAELLGQPMEEVKARVWQNACAFFGPIMSDKIICLP